MDEPVSLAEVKAHLNLEPDDTGDDLLLDGMILPARRACENRINRRVHTLDADDYTVVAQAMKLLIGSWYASRESTAVDVKGIPAELPLTVTWLLEPIRKWATD